MSVQAQDHFIAKWHRREPEMALAEVFCPPATRARFRAWGALVTELREAVFELSDPRVTAVKAPWWAEELLRFAEGLGRHPLAADLATTPSGGSGTAGVGVPWRDLAGAVLRQVHADARPVDPSYANAPGRQRAGALAAAESALFPSRLPSAPDAIAVHLLWQRLPRGLGDDDHARVPLALLARHGLTGAQLASGGPAGEALLRDWATALVQALPVAVDGQPLYRRLRAGLDRVALRRLASGRGFTPESAPFTVLRAWRLARRG